MTGSYNRSTRQQLTGRTGVREGDIERKVKSYSPPVPFTNFIPYPELTPTLLQIELSAVVGMKFML